MTRVVIVREWLLIMSILLGAAGIIAGGYAYHLEQLEDEAEEITVAHLMALVESNQHILSDLKNKPYARPLAFDACAGKALVNVMRDNGLETPKFEFEARCEQAKK